MSTQTEQGIQTYQTPSWKSGPKDGKARMEAHSGVGKALDAEESCFLS